MKFSVIIPLYNKAPYVEKAVRSVLYQTFRDFELVVIDDGSTDGSLHIVELAISGFSSARIISQPNQGVSVARNVGVSMTVGDYVCFLDADDWWAPTFLEEMAGFIRNYPDAGLYCVNYYYVKNRTEQARVDIPTGYFDYFSEYVRLMQMPITSISVAIPRATLADVGLFNPTLKLGEDFDLWLRITFKYKVAFLNDHLAFYNQDVDTKSRGIGRLHAPENHILWNLDKYSEEEKHNPVYKQLIDNLRVYLLFPYYLSKDYREAACVELDKVDWTRQPRSAFKAYQRPIWLLLLKDSLLKVGARVKRVLM